MNIDEPEELNGFTEIGEEDLAEIEELAEAWVASLPFVSVYAFTWRFHVHLLTMMFCSDKEYFEKIREDYKNERESGIEEEDDVTAMLVKRLDSMLGFNGKAGGETLLSVQGEEVELPDKEFFKKLGLD